jgi:hypothetical protein
MNNIKFPKYAIIAFCYIQKYAKELLSISDILPPLK